MQKLRKLSTAIFLLLTTNLYALSQIKTRKNLINFLKIFSIFLIIVFVMISTGCATI
jgi:hypothetical protein